MDNHNNSNIAETQESPDPFDPAFISVTTGPGSGLGAGRAMEATEMGTRNSNLKGSHFFMEKTSK